MRHRLTLLVTGLLCVALATGCTTVSQGEPAPVTTTTTDTTDTTDPSETGDPGGDLPTDGAPAVTDPLDTATFQQDPCRALTADQSTQLNVGSSGKSRDGALGNGCEWANADTLGSTIIDFLDKDPRGLSAVYQANKQGKWAYFEELSPIEGFPAVARDLVDDRDKGQCAIVVGVSDKVAFSLFLYLSRANTGQKDPCEVASQVAGMALQTMKQGG